MNRRSFIALIALAMPVAARAQKTSLPRIGFLDIVRADGSHSGLDSLLAGLRDLHRIEGETIVVERRFVDYRPELLRAAAAELVALRVAVIVAFAPTISAAMEATSTIPIVMRATIDPVAAGYVKSLARPGGNVTGVSSYSGSLYGKRLQLLRDLVPGLARVAVVWNDRSTSGFFAATQAAAKALDLEIVPVTVHEAAEFEAAIAQAKAAGAQALLALRDPIVVNARARLVVLVASYGLPAVYDERQFCIAGGLVSYGADLDVLHRRAAYYVDRILKGAKPADLPVEEPTVFELVINRKAATAIGLAIPPTLLARADQVIE